MIQSDLLENYARRFGYSTFPIISNDGAQLDEQMGVIGFENFRAQQNFVDFINDEPAYFAEKQLFKKDPTEKGLFALGHPHEAIKKLIGIKERGDHLDFTVHGDLYYSGVLIMSNL